jgi:hypothetical protein
LNELFADLHNQINRIVQRLNVVRGHQPRDVLEVAYSFAERNLDGLISSGFLWESRREFNIVSRASVTA